MNFRRRYHNLKYFYSRNKKSYLILIIGTFCLTIFCINSIQDDVTEEKVFISDKKRLFTHKPKKEQLFSSNCLSAFESNEIFNSTQLKRKHPSCPEDWIRIDSEGYLYYKENFRINACQYAVVDWHKNDFDYKISSFKTIKNGSQLDKDRDFFHIKCTYRDSEYYSAFARIFSKETSQILNEKINVFILGLDSVSREDWIENLPKTSEFLTKTLNSKILHRFNIVGDGTPAALIPLLTSKHEEELPNTVKNSKNHQFVDEVYPFIWNKFKSELGYKTLFGEDWPNVGTFQYRLAGMKNPPTDHYTRPFHLSIKSIKNSKFCMGGRTNMRFNLEYGENFMKAYENDGFFGFLFMNEYSHDSTVNLNTIDDDMENFLNYFYNDKQLKENTILILMADHGPRFSTNRKSVIGLLRERNPFFSIYIPDLFKRKYPNEYKNFEENHNKLLTPMDIHRTLIDLISLEKTGKVSQENDGRSLSLFNRISNERTCEQAGIDQHWCACMKRTELEIDQHLEQIASEFILYLNDVILKNHLDKCVRLGLKTINRVDELETYIGMNKTRRKKKRTSIFSKIFGSRLLEEPQIEKDFKKFFFQITTSNNMDGIYEFSVTDEFDYRNGKNEFLIDKNSISRVNMYGNSSHCIFNDFPDLRKYCFCKNK